MIFPVVALDSYLHESFVICLRGSVTEAAMLRRAKITPGTYAADLISRLYEAIFLRSVELKHDYQEYYAVEYRSFGEYLHKRFLFTTEDVTEVSPQFMKSSQIIYFHPRFTFLEGEYGRAFLETLFESESSK